MKFERVELEPGTEFRDLDIKLLDIVNCTVPFDVSFAARPVIENVHLGKLKMRRSRIDRCIFRNVTIDGVDTDIDSSFLTANEYYGVKIRGRVKRGLIFKAEPSQELTAKPYLDAVRRAEAHPDWSIDISEARGEIVVRGYAADGFIIDPETQFVVRNTPETLERWDALDLPFNLFQFAIHDMRHYGWKDTILVADANAKDYEEQLELLRLLRREGVTE